MSDQLKNQVKSNFENYLKTTYAFDANIREYWTRMEAIRQEILAKRTANPQIKMEDVRESLEKINELSYDMALRERDTTQYAILLVEYYTLCQTLDIALELTDDDKNFLEALINGSKSIFALSPTDSSIVVSDVDMYNTLRDQAKKSSNTDEKLAELFSSEMFSVKK